MTKSNFNLAAALETLRVTDHEALGKLLLESVLAGNNRAVVELLDAGAYINAKNNDGGTPLHYAAWRDNTAIVIQLVARGANINAKTNVLGSTPLHNAAIGGHTDVVKHLIDNGAAVDAKDSSGRTPLSYAVECGHSVVVKLLRTAKNTPQRRRKTPAMDDIRMALEGLQNG